MKRLNVESIRLYREILRESKKFQWKNEKGELWYKLIDLFVSQLFGGKCRSDILKASARYEFEQARYENDPEIITQLLVVGRDCLSQTVQKVMLYFRRLTI